MIDTVLSFGIYLIPLGIIAFLAMAEAFAQTPVGEKLVTNDTSAP